MSRTVSAAEMYLSRSPLAWAQRRPYSTALRW